jgi:hypothetical protein
MKMFNWSSENRMRKDEVRNIIFSRRRPIQTYLCLPGWDSINKCVGLCIQRGIDSGSITPETHIIGYEYEADWVDKIRTYLETTYPAQRFTINSGDMSFGKLPMNSIDFAFLDYKGALTYDIYHWMRDVLVPSLMVRSTLVITLSFGRREGVLYQQVKCLLNKDLLPLRNRMCQEYDLWEHEAVLVYMTILKCVLRDYNNDFVLRHVYQDKDHTPMLVFMLEGIEKRQKTPIYPDLDFYLPKGKETNMANHLATIKAARTRKFRARAAKAVNTRRANAEKRTATALKAWATRRAHAKV